MRRSTTRLLAGAGFFLLICGPARAGWELLYLDFRNDNDVLLDISMPNEREACAVGLWSPSGAGGNSEALVVFTRDGGQSWSRSRLEGVLNIPTAVCLTGEEQVGYMTSFQFTTPKIHRTDDGGRTWSEQTLPGDPRGFFSDIFFIDMDTGWAVGGDLAYRTTDGGTTWSQASLPALPGGGSLSGVEFIDADHGFAVGGTPGEDPEDEWDDPVPPSNGFILRSDDGGQSWQTVTEGLEGALQRVSFADSQHGWAVGGGETGLILHTYDGGANWAPQTVPAGQGGAADFVADVDFVDNQSGYAIGNIGEGTPMVLLTEDGGVNWAVDASYAQAFEDLEGFEKMAGWKMLVALSFPQRDLGMVSGQWALVAGYMGEEYCPDRDGDGHTDEACGGDDCDDNNPYVHPDAEESCNGLDENCDGVADDGFDLMTDPDNCGACGFNCQPAQVCWDGVCTSDCPDELTRCGQECVDPATDPDHCGGCDNACSYPNADASCQGGACVMGACREGFTDCDQDEVDGCEVACTPTGEETCDGVDNDCDCEVDEPPADCSGTEPGPETDGGTPDGGAGGDETSGEQDGGAGCGCGHGRAAPVPLCLLVPWGLWAWRRRY